MRWPAGCVSGLSFLSGRNEGANMTVWQGFAYRGVTESASKICEVGVRLMRFKREFLG